MQDQAAIYRKYCILSRMNGSQPVRFDDAFGLQEHPEGLTSVDGGTIQCHYAARAKFKNTKVTGKGTLTLVAGFSATIENTSIHIPSGDLFLFVGPYSEIKDLSIQSFNSENHLHLGAGTTINTGSLLVQGDGQGIFFGHDCMFSTQIHARTSDSHSMFSYETRRRVNSDRSIQVGDHVWIGRHVTISKGACISDDVILGQGSVVGGKIKMSTCYAGVPAKCIKEHVTWERDRTESIDDIHRTYHYRPRQLAVNRFLTEDAAFHLRASDRHDSIRAEYIVQKDYPWIPTISYKD
jgi:acetyltransferase-like isoleucine patch superfamily enzyme